MNVYFIKSTENYLSCAWYNATQVPSVNDIVYLHSDNLVAYVVDKVVWYSYGKSVRVYVTESENTERDLS